MTMEVCVAVLWLQLWFLRPFVSGEKYSKPGFLLMLRVQQHLSKGGGEFYLIYLYNKHYDLLGSLANFLNLKDQTNRSYFCRKFDPIQLGQCFRNSFCGNAHANRLSLKNLLQVIHVGNVILPKATSMWIMWIKFEWVLGNEITEGLIFQATFMVFCFLWMS